MNAFDVTNSWCVLQHLWLIAIIDFWTGMVLHFAHGALFLAIHNMLSSFLSIDLYSFIMLYVLHLLFHCSMLMHNELLFRVLSLNPWPSVSLSTNCYEWIWCFQVRSRLACTPVAPLWCVLGVWASNLCICICLLRVILSSLERIRKNQNANNKRLLIGYEIKNYDF